MPQPYISDRDAIWLIANANEILANLSWPTDVLELTTFFRKTLTPARTHAICELLELRQRATWKYSRAHEMFFHRRGLEQATDESIALYKARRFAALAQPVMDICCGIGGDALALSKLGGNVTILDWDVATTRFAKANAGIYSNNAVTVIVNDLRDTPLSPSSLWHIDPDRRPSDRRRSDPDQCEPPLSVILSMQGLSAHGAIKLSPAADVSELLERGAELEWIGHRRECQQQVAWLGDLARFPGKRSATCLDDLDNITTIVEQEHYPIEIFEGLPKYIYEPSASVLAAKLDMSLAAQWGLQQLTAQASYYASDHLIESPLLSVFEVLDDLAFHRKTLSQSIAALDAQVVEVKKRGVAVDPESLRKEFRYAQGNHAVVLLFYRKGNVTRVTIAQRRGTDGVSLNTSSINPSDRPHR